MAMSTVVYARFCKNVRDILDCREMSQDDLAARMKVSKSYVSQLLNGRAEPGFRTLERVAKALQVDPSDLLAEKISNPC